MHRPHMYRQRKVRRDIPPPQYHQPEMLQRSDCYDHHELCHIHQATPCSRDNPHLHQNPSINETIHCYFCPLSRNQDSYLKVNKIESDPRVQHNKICCHNRHESQSAHLQSRPRSPDSSEDEEHRYHTGHHHTQAMHPNGRQRDPPTVKHFHSKSSNDPFDHVHSHAATPERGTCARTTVCKSHEDGCGSKIKAVRFADDDRMPEGAETHHSNCPIHHTLSPVEDRCHSHRKYRQQESQSRESRTYRWVWGPPLPAVTSRHGKIYHAKNH